MKRQSSPPNPRAALFAEPSEPPSRKPHPLDSQPPAPPPADGNNPQGGTRRRINLRIPSVTPYVVYAIIAINVVVFIIRALSPSLDATFYEVGANNPTAVMQNGEYWRLFTSMFLHAGIYDRFGEISLQGILHILFNMYVLFSVGTQVERLFGHVRFGLIYLLGGLAGSALSAIFNDPRVTSVGASGAVFAILATELVFLYKHRLLLGAAGRAQMSNTLFWIVANIVLGLLSTTGAGLFRVDNFAHIGGALGGAALAWFISPFYIVRRHPDHQGELIADDINPLRNRYWAVSIYLSVLLVGLLAAQRLLFL